MVPWQTSKMTFPLRWILSHIAPHDNTSTLVSQEDCLNSEAETTPPVLSHNMNVMPAANTKEKEVVVNLCTRIDLGSKDNHYIFVWKQDD